MANLNLSEFGEKLFVTDADHTFIWDTANAISKRVSRNSWLNSGTLTSDAPVTISQTWGTTGTYTAAKVNVTETATANPLSNLLDLQVGGTPKLSVKKTGALLFSENGTAFAPIIRFPDAYGSVQGIWNDINNGVHIGSGGGAVYFHTGDVRVVLGKSLIWTSGASQQLALVGETANTLALRNGAAAQTFNVYGTWTTAITNFERLAIKYNTTDLAYQIAAEKGTTNGDYRPLQLWTGGASRLHITTAGNVGIGTTSPTSKLHVEGNALITGNVSLSNGSVTVLGTRGFTLTPADGIFQFLNNAQTGFDRIQLGGASTGHPAIKRNGASIDITLASDGITFTSIQDLYRRFGSGTPEGAVIAPIGAVFHRTDGGAGTSFYVKESGTGNTGWVGK